MLSAIVLTYNSSASIQRTIDALKKVSDDICVVDSFSSDNTIDILRANGCHIVQHPFENYSKQRNWAIDNLRLKYDWQIHVDADEELEPDLIERVRSIDFSAKAYDGYIIGRKMVFLGKILRFGGTGRTWHYRIFRSGYGRCEDRLYDQHFVGTGRVGTIDAFMLDHQEDTLAEWTARHNRWSDMEAKEVMLGAPPKSSQVASRFTGNRIEQKRAQKGLYYRSPLFFRAIAYFLFSYIFRLGFLDGWQGLIYNCLQGFWFRFLVDAKIYEASWRAGRSSGLPSAGD